MARPPLSKLVRMLFICLLDVRINYLDMCWMEHGACLATCSTRLDPSGLWCICVCVNWIIDDTLMLPLFGPNFFSETLGIKGRAFWFFFFTQVSGCRTNSGPLGNLYVLFLGKPTSVRHSALTIYTSSSQPVFVEDACSGYEHTVGADQGKAAWGSVECLDAHL